MICEGVRGLGSSGDKGEDNKGLKRGSVTFGKLFASGKCEGKE